MSENPFESPNSPLEIDDLANKPQPMASPMQQPRLWTVWAVFGLSFVALIGVSIIASLAFLMPDIIDSIGNEVAPEGMTTSFIDKLTTPLGFLVTGFPPQLAIMLIALAAAHYSPVPFRERLGLTSTGLSAIQILIVALGSFLPAAIGMGIAILLTFVIPADESAAKLWENMTIEFAVPFVLFIALLPGFGEELLFRGYFQRRLLQRWSPGLAIFSSSIVFGLVHIMPHTVVFAFFVGLWLGYIAWKIGSIWPTILAHVLINGIWNIINISHNLMDYPDSVYYVILCVTLLVGVICFVLSLPLLNREKPVAKTAI